MVRSADRKNVFYHVLLHSFGTSLFYMIFTDKQLKSLVLSFFKKGGGGEG